MNAGFEGIISNEGELFAKEGTIYEKVEHSQFLPVKVVKIDLCDEMLKFAVSRHWHRSLEIIIPKAGNALVWFDGNDHRINAGDICIINSGTIHACHNDNSRGEYHGYAIQIPFLFLKENVPDFEAYRFDEVIKNCDSEVVSIIDSIIEAYGMNNDFDSLKVKALVYELIYTLIKDYSKKKDVDSAPNEIQRMHLTEAINFLDGESDNIISVNEVAEYCGLSYGYIANLFTEFLGVSMSEYLNRIRIEKAEDDLVHTKKSITEIVVDRGFKNAKSFYREFGRAHDVSPKDYRKRYMRK